MDFNFTEEQIYFKRQAARAIKELIEPHASTIDKEDRFPRELFERLGSLGYYGIRYPQKIGGMGADCTTFTILAEELARVSVTFAAIVTMQCLMGTDFIHRFGTKDHIERLLKPAIRGEKIGTIAFTEPDCGSDLGAIKTRALKKHDGYVIKGRKMWITSAEIADFVTVIATTDPSKRINGLAFFLVEKGMPGFSVGQRINKMSARGSVTGELIFDDCLIPPSNLLGEEGQGARYLEEILSEIRIMIAGLGLGLSRGAYEKGLMYAKEREAFGKSIADFQLIQEKIAEMEMRIRSTWLLTYHAAWLKDNNLSAKKEAAIAKLYATETANYVVDQVSRIYGAYGIAEEYHIERLYRDARFLLYGGGTSEILRTLIAKACIKE
ncbi:MAG TPA: acyl-CoA dehydrogenase family protein [Syntrophorhabdus sp.]|nr:acyl-CoA dehydrogenase family protein [Syntrophorhabdus sp.]HNS78582.1 acyl-CoA dehydrogenase family protein [Syntrophorhabdus sp.]HQM75818.1 acyl-CoA dehydrogenase family protein [Syntrophorhabdaceae bacterium]